MPLEPKMSRYRACPGIEHFTLFNSFKADITDVILCSFKADITDSDVI